jgi:hypothetical protein
MSLSALPTELDIQILQHAHDPCDKRSFGRLSSLNRYYYSLAEPIIYRDIVIPDHAEFCLKHLLIDWVRAVDHSLRKNFASMPPPSRIWLAHTRWLKRFPYVLHHTASNRSLYLIDTSRAIDCTLALVLVLATNVKMVALGFSVELPLDTTIKVLDIPWHDMCFTTARPLAHLKRLRIEGRHHVQDILALEHLKSPSRSLQLRNCHIRYGYLFAAGVIQELDLYDVTVATTCVEMLISSPGVHNLRELKLRKLRGGPVFGWAT